MCYIHAAALVAEYLKRKGMSFSAFLIFVTICYVKTIINFTFIVVAEQNTFRVFIMLVYACERGLYC